MIKRAITKVHKAERSPERCMICNSDTENWYMDTGIDTQFDGTFYIGRCCVNKIVALSPEHFTHEQVTRLLHENRVLKAEAEQAREHAEHELKLLQLRFARIKEYMYE